MRACRRQRAYTRAIASDAVVGDVGAPRSQACVGWLTDTQAYDAYYWTLKFDEPYYGSMRDDVAYERTMTFARNYGASDATLSLERIMVPRAYEPEPRDLINARHRLDGRRR